MIDGLVQKALAATRESKHVEFKENFDPSSTADCCEIAKDFIALANSGGGILVIGLDSFGVPVPLDRSHLQVLDPVDVTNKIGKYIGARELSFTMEILEKGGVELFAFLVESAPVPLIFEKPGTYSDGGKGQKTAFGQGTVFFRHGAKSEPGINIDLEKSLERQLEAIRKSWMSGVRKLVRSPISQIADFISAEGSEAFSTSFANVKTGTGRNLPEVRVTRNPKAATDGVFLHEKVSESLFGEINNVIDVNRFLFSGRKGFLLGPDVYYRIYAERQKIEQDEGELEKLFARGLTDYFPFLHWCTLLSDEVISQHFANAVLQPHAKLGYTLVRLVPLLGTNFQSWVQTKFDRKWGKYSQPPAIHWRLKELPALEGAPDPRLTAARMGPASAVALPDGARISASELLDDHTYLNDLLSKTCLDVFNGEKGAAETARDIDYLAYGLGLMERGPRLGARIQSIVGDRLPDV